MVHWYRIKVDGPAKLCHVKDEPNWNHDMESKVVNLVVVANPELRVTLGIQKSVPRASRKVSV